MSVCLFEVSEIDWFEVGIELPKQTMLVLKAFQSVQRLTGDAFQQVGDVFLDVNHLEELDEILYWIWTIRLWISKI